MQNNSRRYRDWPRLWLITLLGGAVLLGSVVVGRAEPYLRVSKNGVIYYYFATPGESEAAKPAAPGKKPAPRNRPASPPKASSQDVENWIAEASRQYRLPPSLIKAVIRVESNFNPGATSPKGAQGLMQLMPQTADGLAVADAYDPRENIWAGTRYLSMLLDKFQNRLPLALAAYNAGPQRVSRNEAVPPIRETQFFVRDVCHNFLKYHQPLPGASQTAVADLITSPAADGLAGATPPASRP